ncbi:MAG: DUF4202 family protein [Candidatus Paceibacterota bacterium]
MVIDIELTLNRFGFGKIARNKFQLFFLRFSFWKIPNKYSISFEINWRKKEKSLYNKVVEYVDKAFGKKKSHFERAVYWIEKLIPNATEAHKISAYAHDIERGIKGESDRDYLNPEILKRHSEEGAEIIGKFLEKNGADIEIINKVKHLISKHEFGGDVEQNALMDADSISYLETNAKHFVEKRVLEDGYEKIKEKLDWMYNRISSDEYRKFAKENYEKWSRELEKYK